MFCRNCGYKLKDEALFCPKCGTRVKTAASSSPDRTMTADDRKDGGTASAISQIPEPPVRTALSSVSGPLSEVRQSQEALNADPSGKAKGKRLVVWLCCLGGIGVVCISVALFLFLRRQDARHAGETQTAIVETVKETDITPSEAVGETPDVLPTEETFGATATMDETPVVTEKAGEAPDATSADSSEGSLPEAAEDETVNGQEGSTAATMPQVAVQRPLMSQEELEAEVLRIRQVWQFDREAISDGTFGHAIVGDDVHVYTLDGDVRMIEIPGGNDDGSSRTFQIEDGWLTFAFYESSRSQVRLYFKDDQLFRWIQTDAGEEAVIHDQENDNVDFIQNGERALSESYAILDHLQ